MGGELQPGDHPDDILFHYTDQSGVWTSSPHQYQWVGVIILTQKNPSNPAGQR